jgi:hypothetical protein
MLGGGVCEQKADDDDMELMTLEEEFSLPSSIFENVVWTMKKLILPCTGGPTCLLKSKFFLNALLYAIILSLSSASPDCYA